MAQIPLGVYKTVNYYTNQGVSTPNVSYSISPSYNTPYGSSQSSLDEALKSWSPEEQTRQLQSLNDQFKFGAKSLQEAFGQPSPFATDAQGNLTTQKAMDETAKNEAATAAGTMKKVPVGNGFGYIPTGSAADVNMQGGSFQQQAATPTAQQPGVVPIDPNQPQQNPQGQQAVAQQTANQTQNMPLTGAMALQQAMQAVYASRPDLQGLYNPDGSAKNKNDPRIAGIPTLEDWARKFGVNESPVIKNALNSSASSTGSQAGAAGSAQTAAPGTTGAGAGSLGNPNTVQNNSVKKYVDQYKDILNQLGVPDLKTQIDNTTKKYTDLQNELNDKVAEANNNPWFSEAQRSKEIAHLGTKYEGKTTILTNQLALYNNQYSQALSEADNINGEIVADQTAAKVAAQKALEANQQLVLDYGVNKPFYSLDGQTMIRSSDGKVYSSFESWQADGGSAQNYQMIGGQMTLADQKQFQLSLMNATTSRMNAASGPGILSPAQMNATINSIAGAFDNEPIVKQYNTIAETVNAVQNAGNSPTDDIQRIYAVAKVMDPNSAVREGEYKTVQDYATSLLQRAGLNAQRVFDNKGFLTSEARTFINTTLQNRLASSKTNYDNVYKSYQERISQVQNGGFNSITDYSQAFSPGSNSNPLQSMINQARTNGDDNATILRDLINSGVNTIEARKAVFGK